MGAEVWVVLAVALGGGLFLVLIPVLGRGRRRSRERPRGGGGAEGSVVAPFMIDGDKDGGGEDGEGGGD